MNVGDPQSAVITSHSHDDVVPNRGRKSGLMLGLLLAAAAAAIRFLPVTDDFAPPARLPPKEGPRPGAARGTTVLLGTRMSGTRQAFQFSIMLGLRKGLKLIRGAWCTLLVKLRRPRRGAGRTHGHRCR
jgi:hypothetical protein